MSDDGRNSNGTFKKGFTGNRKGAPPRRAHVRTALDILQDDDFDPVAKDLPPDIAPEYEAAYRTLQAAFRGSKRARRQIAKHIMRRHKEWVQNNARMNRTDVKRKIEPIDPRNADEALVLLQIAQDSNSDNPHKRQLKLAVWAVQAAIGRRHGGHRLTDREINEIKFVTAEADRLMWPRGYK